MKEQQIIECGNCKSQFRATDCENGELIAELVQCPLCRFDGE